MFPESCKDNEIKFGDIIESDGDEADNCDEGWEGLSTDPANASVFHADKRRSKRKIVQKPWDIGK